MGIFNQIGTADMGDTSGKYFPPGFMGKARIESVILKTTRDKGDAFIAEFEILESNRPDVEVGSRYTWFQKDNDSAPREVTNFLAACKGFDPYSTEGQNAFKAAFNEAARKQLFADATGQHNVLGDTVLEIETYGKKTRRGDDFTVHRFYPSAAAAAATTPCPAEWQRDESGTFALNPATNAWHIAATGAVAS